MTPPSFHRLVGEYLTARRGLGFDLETAEGYLRTFASHADRIGHSGPVTIELAVQWARSSRSTNPAQAARRLAVVRQFARYRALFDPATEVPPAGLLGRIPRRSTPHIYSEADGGFLGSFLPGGDLFSNSEFELNREQHGGVVSVWSRSSLSHFGGAEGALSLGGDVRTTMFGADYTRGALVVGLSVGRTLGLGGYSGPSAGQMISSMTGFYPWVGYQVNDRVSVWGVTGYGTGALSLAPAGAASLETGLSMAMTAAGTRGELIGSRATGGFALAFKADALWVGAATGQVDAARRAD